MIDDDPTVSEYAEYCQTQSRLLSGRIETLGDRADELLTEIDRETSEVRDRLDASGAPSAGQHPDPEAAVSEIETKQDRVREIQSRVTRCRELAEGYAALGARLIEEEDRPAAALTAVVRFEIDEAAHDCFEERTTLAEQIAGVTDGE